MPRPKTFDESDVLERAMELFWTKGYEGTSVTDLTEHLGVHPGSLYRTFGDKHALYLRALGHYRESQARTLAPMLTEGGPVLPRIRQVMVHHLDLAVAQDEPRGCLAVNAVGERMPGDAGVADCVRTAFAVVENGFLQGLRHAEERGEIRAGLDLPAQATMLTMLLHGLQVQVKVDPDPLRLTRAIDAALAPLLDLR